MENINLDVAERFYKNHLKNVSKYQKKHPEKMKEKSKEYNKNLKENNPDKYREMLDKKKQYYLNVVKPKREAKKADTEKHLRGELIELQEL